MEDTITQVGKLMRSATSKIKEQAEAYMDRGTPLEKSLREATANTNWGCGTTVLAEIARASFDYYDYFTVMRMVWECLADKPSKWRRIFKTLTLLDYLLKNGADRVIEDTREPRSLHRLKTFMDFHYSDQGVDKGAGIRKKAKEMQEMLNDSTLLKQEREKARKNRNRYVGYGVQGERTGPGFTYNADFERGATDRGTVNRNSDKYDPYEPREGQSSTGTFAPVDTHRRSKDRRDDSSGRDGVNMWGEGDGRDSAAGVNSHSYASSKGSSVDSAGDSSDAANRRQHNSRNSASAKQTTHRRHHNPNTQHHSGGGDHRGVTASLSSEDQSSYSSDSGNSSSRSSSLHRHNHQNHTTGNRQRTRRNRERRRLSSSQDTGQSSKHLRNDTTGSTAGTKTAGKRNAGANKSAAPRGAATISAQQKITGTTADVSPLFDPFEGNEHLPDAAESEWAAFTSAAGNSTANISTGNTDTVLPDFFSAPRDTATPVFNNAPPVYNAAPPVYNAAPPVYNAAPPVYNNAPPVYNNTPPVYNHGLPNSLQAANLNFSANLTRDTPAAGIPSTGAPNFLSDMPASLFDLDLSSLTAGTTKPTTGTGMRESNFMTQNTASASTGVPNFGTLQKAAEVYPSYPTTGNQHTANASDSFSSIGFPFQAQTSTPVPVPVRTAPDAPFRNLSSAVPPAAQLPFDLGLLP